MKTQSVKYFTNIEKRQFLKILKDSKKGWRDYYLFHLMLMTGIRISAITNLNVSDIFNGYEVSYKLEFIGKGETKRFVPLNSIIRKHTEQYLRKIKHERGALNLESPLFLSQHKKRITSRTIQLNFKNWLIKSGIEGNFTPHSLRHTVGFELYDRTNGNIRYVQEFLGHASITSTQIYTGITKDQLQECAELLI